MNVDYGSTTWSGTNSEPLMLIKCPGEIPANNAQSTQDRFVEDPKARPETNPEPKERSTASVSAIEPDWTREKRCGGPCRSGYRLLRTIRAYQYWRGRWGFLGRLIAKLYVVPYRFWSVLSGADIPINTILSGGLLLPHPNGIVIHPNVKMGPNCMLFQQVTLGAGGQRSGVPQLGGHVDVGAGAKILGGVSIGDHAKIGANAVVLTDVPAHCSAVGIPARILPPKV